MTYDDHAGGVMRCPEMATMHQMAFKYKDTNIMQTTRFKLVIDYIVSDRQLSVLEVRGLQFQGTEGEILVPASLRDNGDRDADEEEDSCLKAARKIMQDCTKKLQRNDAKDSIFVDASSKTNRKRTAPSENTEPTSKSWSKRKKQKGQAKADDGQPKLTSTTAAVIMDRAEHEDADSGRPDAANEHFELSGGESESDGDGGRDHLQQVLRHAEHSWLAALNAEDPVDTGADTKIKNIV